MLLKIWWSEMKSVVCVLVWARQSTQPDLPAQGCSSRLTQTGRLCQGSTATMEDHSVIFSHWRQKITTSIESSNEQQTISKSTLLISHNQVLRLSSFFVFFAIHFYVVD